MQIHSRSQGLLGASTTVHYGEYGHSWLADYSASASTSTKTRVGLPSTDNVRDSQNILREWFFTTFVFLGMFVLSTKLTFVTNTGTPRNKIFHTRRKEDTLKFVTGTFWRHEWHHKFSFGYLIRDPHAGVEDGLVVVVLQCGLPPFIFSVGCCCSRRFSSCPFGFVFHTSLSGYVSL